MKMLLLCFVQFIVHASIFCPCFSEKQSANQPKKQIREFSAIFKLKSTSKNSGTLEEQKNHPKKSLKSVLHQAIQLSVRPWAEHGFC